jgi:hypothetical protein
LSDPCPFHGECQCNWLAAAGLRGIEIQASASLPIAADVVAPPAASPDIFAAKSFVPKTMRKSSAEYRLDLSLAYFQVVNHFATTKFSTTLVWEFDNVHDCFNSFVFKF